jgi:hypothetical protein
MKENNIRKAGVNFDSVKKKYTYGKRLKGKGFW